MPVRIHPKRLPRVYLAEWRDSRGLTQQQLADRLGTSDVSIARWENGKRRPDLGALAALCEALDIAPGSIYRHPDTPSADDLLRGQPKEIQDQAMKLIMAIRR